MHDKKETLGWLLEHGGFRSMEIVNAEGFTPLTMAGKRLQWRYRLYNPIYKGGGTRWLAA